MLNEENIMLPAVIPQQQIEYRLIILKLHVSL